MKDILQRAAQIKLLIFDIDGVLTNGQIIIGDDSQEYKAFHVRDGHGMKLLHEHGVEIAIITGRTSKVVEHRMANLGITHVYQGQLEKLPAYEKLIAKLGIDARHTAYVGDDIVDLPIMLRAGLAIAVADAHPLVAKHAHWQTPHNGGEGAARDVCELILEAQGALDGILQRYLV